MLYKTGTNKDTVKYSGYFLSFQSQCAFYFCKWQITVRESFVLSSDHCSDTDSLCQQVIFLTYFAFPIYKCRDNYTIVYLLFEDKTTCHGSAAFYYFASLTCGYLCHSPKDRASNAASILVTMLSSIAVHFLKSGVCSTKTHLE